jgi:hypothetical protein
MHAEHENAATLHRGCSNRGPRQGTKAQKCVCAETMESGSSLGEFRQLRRAAPLSYRDGPAPRSLRVVRQSSPESSNVPRLSVIVVFHDMQREAPRTLQTLSPASQRGVTAADYEVIAVDVGSDPPLAESLVTSLGPGFRGLRFPRMPSPAAAINVAVRESRGDSILVCIDGARMLTPGIVRYTLAALAGFPERFVASLSWHLGPKVQNESMLEGYDREVEDRLLESVDWRADGYRLFQIGCLAQSSSAGWLGAIDESNCIGMRRDSWHRLEGYEERFISPGGGLVNPDFYRRACDLLGAPVILLGEGTFHQFHGGVATNAPRAGRPVRPMLEEYIAIRGSSFVAPAVQPLLLGGLSDSALPWLAMSLRSPLGTTRIG